MKLKEKVIRPASFCDTAYRVWSVCNRRFRS